MQRAVFHRPVLFAAGVVAPAERPGRRLVPSVSLARASAVSNPVRCGCFAPPCCAGQSVLGCCPPSASAGLRGTSRAFEQVALHGSGWRAASYLRSRLTGSTVGGVRAISRHANKAAHTLGLRATRATRLSCFPLPQSNPPLKPTANGVALCRHLKFHCRRCLRLSFTLDLKFNVWHTHGSQL